MEILYLTNIPSPYVVDFLNELGKKADVVAVFERLTSSERDKSWGTFKAEHFTYRVLRGIHYDVDKSICPSVICILKKNQNRKIILSNPATLTGIIAIAWLKQNHVPYALQVEGGVPKNGQGIKERIKKYCFSGASHYFSSGKKTDEYLTFYGAEPEKISRYPFTSISGENVIPAVKPHDAKVELRSLLGIEGEFVVIAVGQFIRRKGFDVLIDSLGRCDKRISAYIVGGSPTKEYITLCQKWNLDNVHFVDFQIKETLLKWMEAADLFVMPTRYDIWGLVVNEAMSQGLPVVSSDACVAGYEMIENWKNGVLFRNEDVAALSDIIIKIYSDNELLEEMSNGALNTAREYTFEKMVEAHMVNW